MCNSNNYHNLLFYHGANDIIIISSTTAQECMNSLGLFDHAQEGQAMLEKLGS